MVQEQQTLDKEGLRQFQSLSQAAVSAVTARFYAEHGSLYARFGEAGRELCREDLAFHLDFLRPVLEFGLLQAMVDYLSWLDSVLKARGIPSQHLALSLTWLAEYFESHMAGANGTCVVGALQAARDCFVAAGDTPPEAPRAPAPWPQSAAFEAALLAGKQRDALDIVTRCLADGSNLVDIEMHVMAPALYEIGEKWQANKVSVAQEHMATAIVQSVMTVALLQTPPQPSNGKRVLFACVEGNNHAVGLRMVADAFQMGGWDVQYLGANVPTPALVRHTLESQPDLIGLSVSFPQQLRVVKDFITRLKEQVGENRPGVIVGGLAINRFRQLADAIGADDTGTDACAALESARRLVARTGVS